MRFVIAAIILASTPARADVHINVYAADNLADTLEPVPKLAIDNDTGSPIEIQIFEGVPATGIEHNPNNAHGIETGGACGNGYTAHRIAPHTDEFFPLWLRTDHGPGESGTYDVTLSYTLRGKQRVAKSDPFTLAYGDVAPQDPRDAKHPGHVVVVSAERQHNAALDQPSPSALATKLLPDVNACVAAAQKRIPWLRGTFALVVYQYNDPAPTLYIESSLLGDKIANTCLGAIKVKDSVPSEYTMTFAVSPSTP